MSANDFPNQSHLQRRYYWAIVRHGALSLLPSKPVHQAEREVHEVLKAELLGYEEVVDSTGASFLRSISTTTLNWFEFSSFLEAALAYLADRGVTMPDHAEDLMTVPPHQRNEWLPEPSSTHAQGNRNARSSVGQRIRGSSDLRGQEPVVTH